MSTVTLGRKPGELVVETVTGADFTATLTYEVGGVVTDWPGGTVLSLVFENGVTFTATIATSVATFEVDKAVVNTIPAAGTARLLYVNGSTDRTLYLGRGYRRG